ncbi:pre-mRNA-splicing factor syf2 [Nilaparvata lugens]|uniref:pre-mRNA-splicing factor syf2 n=1 Tax=Nilaparvata lugens TaxID=108931 RepID=UPI000B990EC8|nr:pre-mRNA-splicing factor syf2 [Nilaparvata lugens]XP_022202297.1 pre-mRNA-splicing factor syf2 [Nilaparvata lugens]XP_022202298.1 pre-mRNA-splicing factor syf2 [Nilaparvata lugens]XP_039280008.1 pre-mRNA-splicing factor syf2 [Nilaparvata lugens]XP_039280016.1 pre-mRNA-splicing factor syf2 [Nilaparvata lugens]XP_039280020.1 pre-mRNA-splicing factor syf2 [Nilaparvata lugens]
MAECSSSNLSTADKLADRMKRLKELHLKRNEARQLNHQEVVEEDKRNKLPSNWEARRRKAEWILNDEEQKKQAEQKGEDYDRVKLLNVGADEAERLEKKRRKANPDTGFADYEQATIRQYNRLVRNMKPDLDNYGKQKEKLGDAFYGGRNTILHGLHNDSKEGIDAMVSDLEKQISKREKYSRRRMHNDDADIDYINERNMKFNEKLERFYGQHTTEIKQNLERGTAV